MTTKHAPSDDGEDLTARPSLTRRSLFEFAGLAVAAAAFQSRINASAPPPAGGSAAAADEFASLR